MPEINEKTKIPLSLVAVILSGILPLSALWYDTRANAKDIEQMKSEYRVLAKDLVETQKQMITELTEIKTQLKNR